RDDDVIALVGRADGEGHVVAGGQAGNREGPARVPAAGGDRDPTLGVGGVEQHVVEVPVRAEVVAFGRGGGGEARAEGDGVVAGGVEVRFHGLSVGVDGAEVGRCGVGDGEVKRLRFGEVDVGGHRPHLGQRGVRAPVVGVVLVEVGFVADDQCPPAGLGGDGVVAVVTEVISVEGLVAAGR